MGWISCKAISSFQARQTDKSSYIDVISFIKPIAAMQWGKQDRGYQFDKPGC